MSPSRSTSSHANPFPPSGLYFVLLMAFATAAVCLAPRPSTAGGGPRPIERALTSLGDVADSLVKKSAPDADAWVDSVGREAGARGDRATQAAAQLWIGSRRGTHDYDYAASLPHFAAALSAARALRDSFALATVLTQRAWAAQLAGGIPDAKRDYIEAVRLARRGGLPEIEGFAHRGLGSIAKNAGEYQVARRELEAAVRQLPFETFYHLHTRFLLAEVLNRTGHHDEARDAFLDILEEAKKRRNRWMIAACMNDIGIVDFGQGDMVAADRNWAVAAAHFDTLALRSADQGSAVNARINQAHALIVLGRLDDAEALLDEQIIRSVQISNPEIRLGVLGEMGLLMRRAGRAERAEKLLRAVRAASTTDAQLEESSTIDLASLLTETGRPAAAEALIDSLLVPARRARMTKDNVGAALLERSAARRAQGRHSEAIEPAREAERVTRATRGGKASIYWLDAAVELARCQRALGQPDDAAAGLAQAARSWEKWRGEISDFEWRERAGSGLAGLFTEYGLALLDARRPVPAARRVRQTFDALQVFQARTLEERMQGLGLAARAMTRRVTADSLRRSILRPDEGLVDLVATPDTTFAFVLTRGGITVRLLPGTRRLEALHRDWRDAMLAGASRETVESGLGRLSEELLAPLSAALRDRRRIIITGGGPLTLWPMGALHLSGEATALGETREIAVAPSATLFALLRARAVAPHKSSELLALCRTTNAAGRELPGAERELTMLDRAFFGVTLRTNHGDRTVPELTSDLRRFDALHFAAHAEASAATPWRSGFLLGRGSGEGAYLRASNVARMRLSARLAVLSGCQSAGATALAGEGALGLSSGFLSAGTSTVIATLWPIDDRTAERYMAAFYEALGRGQSAAGAARAAVAALRRSPETAKPRDWAAFVVIGEPGTTLTLKPRSRG